MTETECVRLVAYLASRCPSMRLEDSTPSVWYDDLSELDHADCHQAVRDLTTRQPYVALCDLLTEARTVQSRRLGRQRVAELEAERLAIESEPAEPVDREAVKRQLQALAAKKHPLKRSIDTTDPARMAQARREVEALRKRQQETAGEAS
jgi:hypothetical protein